VKTGRRNILRNDRKIGRETAVHCCMLLQQANGSSIVVVAVATNDTTQVKRDGAGHSQTLQLNSLYKT